MKSLHVLCVGLVIMMVPLVRAQDDSTTPAARFTKATFEQTEKNLAQALEANSSQMQTTAALTVKDLKRLYPEQSLSSLVIPLMRIVKDEDLPCATRCVAAIALHDLHSAMGDFAIQRTAIYTDCLRTKHICNWLTYYRWLENHPENSGRAITMTDAPVEPLPEEFIE